MTATWQTTSPALSTVMEANLQTIGTWVDNLPAPQTDVERTVRRRWLKRQHELVSKKLEEFPDIRGKLNGRQVKRRMGC